MLTNLLHLQRMKCNVGYEPSGMLGVCIYVYPCMYVCMYVCVCNFAFVYTVQDEVLARE